MSTVCKSQDRSPLNPNIYILQARTIEFLDRCQTTGATAAARELREWVKHQ